MNKKVTRSIVEGIYYTKFELVEPDLAFAVVFMTNIPIEDVAHTKVPSRQIDLVSDWTVHRKDDNGIPCTYFDKCSMYDAWRWGDEKWFLDNITPDTDDFESRVFARMEAYLNQ